MLSGVASASVIYVGGDLTSGGAWRTSSTAKTQDIDGNNIYGSDGYYIVGSPATVAPPTGLFTATPSYVSSMSHFGNLYAGGHQLVSIYQTVDNPSVAGSMNSGLLYVSSFEDDEDDLFQFTLVANASFRFGVLVDNADFLDISPSSLRLRQTVGGPSNSGLISTASNANLSNDWYFFDVTGVAGDEFVLSGINWFNDSNFGDTSGIGGVVFDSPAGVPEPATLFLCSLALGGLALRKRLS
jgi:hypothetical protein